MCMHFTIYVTLHHFGVLVQKGETTWMHNQGLFFVNAPSQWKRMLHCNVVSHWLGAYTNWSLIIHRGMVMHICINEPKNIIALYNGLASVWLEAITLTNDDIFRPSGTHFNNILFEIQTFKKDTHCLEMCHMHNGSHFAQASMLYDTM